MSNIATIEIVNDMRLLGSTLTFIESLAQELGFAKGKAARLRLSCEEILANRLQNAYTNTGKIVVEVLLQKDILEVSIKDMGIPYWTNESAFDPRNIVSNTEGLEFFLAARSVDRYGLEKLGKNGQRTYVQMFLPQEMELKKEKEVEAAPLDSNFRCKRVGTDITDIIAAITCIYNAYGYLYGYEALYYPEKFRELIEAGKFHSILAVNEHNEIGGHLALAFHEDFPSLPELATLAVKSSFRKYGLGRMLFEYGFKIARGLDVNGVLSQPTAFHNISQRICHSNGFTATGFLFHYVNEEARGLYNQGERRLDLAICVKLFNLACRTIYPPPEHCDFIAELYAKLGCAYEVGVGIIPSADGLFQWSINTPMRICKIIVNNVGAEIASSLDNVLNYCAKNKMEMVEMYLNMCEPGCVFGYAKAQEKGFIFTGIMPGSSRGDYLIMQHLLDYPVNFDAVVADLDYADVFKYISSVSRKGCAV
ncbi:MAG: hypothetical protein PHO01_12540 [Desulfotomaculaceae bacterium]|nr:hypothetical protein [Desulfotomaculaceae bacterium]